MNNMFYGCKGLRKLDISGFTSKKVGGMVRMFSYVGNLDEFDCNDSKIEEAYRKR